MLPQAAVAESGIAAVCAWGKRHTTSGVVSSEECVVLATSIEF